MVSVHQGDMRSCLRRQPAYLTFLAAKKNILISGRNNLIVTKRLANRQHFVIFIRSMDQSTRICVAL